MEMDVHVDGMGWAEAVPVPQGFSVDAAQQPLGGGMDDTFGTVRWRTLVSADRTPSDAMVLGVAEFEPNGDLLPHRHAQAEFYFGLEGSGTVTIDGMPHPIAPGVAVFIPGNAEHGVVAGQAGLRFTYGFATARFADVDYRFSDV